MDEPQRDDGLLEEPQPAPAAVPPEQWVAAVTQAQNLVGEVSEDKLKEIARTAIDDWKLDKDSMSDWFEQMKRGIDLARMVKETKRYPFENASNVVYPLVTSAALQFNARAYPAIVAPDRVVKAKVWGNDAMGQKAARADRVSEHMSWQLSSRIPEWEASTDSLLMQLPIVGSMVRKWWRDPVERRARCRLIDAGKFIVNAKVKSLEEAPRVTEELSLYPVEIETRVRSGQFVAFDYDPDPEDGQAPQDFVEQHTRIDLDGDGYGEPYVVTVHVERQTVVRLVADFGPSDVEYRRETQMVPAVVPMPVQTPMGVVAVPMQQMMPQEVATGILCIKRGSYFVKFDLMPSVDGGFHGIGFGLLLGDISESINSIVNMLLDAGHYASLGGGFIGSELRLKGGAQRMRPGEWRLASAPGGDVRSAIVPLTFPGPDATLFQMLGLLIEAGKEITSTKDIMTGDAGPRQQTATTTVALIEQGMTLFTAAYKRVFRSLKAEYALLARINAETVTPEEYNAFHDGEEQYDPRADYGAADMDVEPVADPRSVTKMQEAAKAQLVMQLAEMGLVNPQEALRRVAEGMDLEDVEQLIPQPDPMQQEMMLMQVAAARAEVANAMANVELTLAQVEGERAGAFKDVASAAAAEGGLRLEAVKAILEDQRARLDSVLRGPGGVAKPSGDGGAAGGHGPRPGPAQGAAVRALLGGAIGPGVRPSGPAGGGAV